MKEARLIKEAKRYVNMLLGPLENHYYHQYEHALDVMERCIYLANREWLSDNDLELLSLASLFHDTWFIIEYDDNEEIGAKIARNYLKSILYPEDKIKIVMDMIIATKVNVEPTNILEQIIKDADTDNLGRDDFFEKWDRLKRELELIKQIKIKDSDWVHYSIEFLKKHIFYTPTELIERENKKKENMKKIEERLKS